MGDERAGRWVHGLSGGREGERVGVFVGLLGSGSNVFVDGRKVQ